ncbi:MAG TPA: serine/threonine-protein kinase [Pyrinomonadaceae bacterium]|nr:serine/threonine-protein kinase [Pyrinomonadaceae bacterium]
MCPADHTPLQADATIADVPIDPLLGQIFDEKYRLEARLGGGGMGTVYRATHLLIDRPVALKVLSQRFVGDETAQQRFRREARAAGRMQHPNAVSVTDFGTTADGYLYIVMELLEGHTLRDVLMREGPLDVARAVSIMLQTSAAVAAAHDAGLIHRDLKPGNIFIAQRADTVAVVKVLDFGVAKFAVEEQADDDYQTLTQVGALIGTPRYMSPEQCSGSGPVTPASDVYSLGIILYEMLSGATPFNAETPLAIVFRQVSEPPPPLPESVPQKLRAIVQRALAKDPMKRFANAEEFRQELLSTAEILGLEYSGSKAKPLTLAALRSSGAESPSGSLVIDIEKLRQVQAASQAREGNGDGSAVASPVRREISRLNIGVIETKKRKREIALATVILVLLILGSGVVIGRWWRNRVVSNAVASASPSPSPSPRPSPTPIESPTPTPAPQGTPANRPPRNHEKPSKFKRAIDKIKGIFS